MPFRFLDLSREIRDEIYGILLSPEDLVFKDGEGSLGACLWSPLAPITIAGSSCHFDLPVAYPESIRADVKMVSHHILFANRQIHREAAQVLYGTNTLNGIGRYFKLSFFKNIGQANRGFIRKLSCKSDTIFDDAMFHSERFSLPRDNAIPYRAQEDARADLECLHKINRKLGGRLLHYLPKLQLVRLHWDTKSRFVDRLYYTLGEHILKTVRKLHRETLPTFTKFYYQEAIRYALSSEDARYAVREEHEEENNSGDEPWTLVDRAYLLVQITLTLPSIKQPKDVSDPSSIVTLFCNPLTVIQTILLTPEHQSRLLSNRLLGCHPSTAGVDDE
ncbi:hypothetical protein UCRPC4_g01377 [Phaeomoniella chlamydospora]|uniref:Uncharacterized protein n=1 Tax=Phaeomoniella chlamydospora TaxID=158046 RepID=A0A0G2EXX4_PHACM|nr:hypothetical protein UCRPC4_g01377 [Phaeomoniella chlamydospora]